MGCGAVTVRKLPKMDTLRRWETRVWSIAFEVLMCSSVVTGAVSAEKTMAHSLREEPSYD